MPIQIEDACEHNLQHVDVTVPDGLTVVTGISGSGKTSLVFDTLYHEARRRFQGLYCLGNEDERLMPADVRAIRGLGPAIAVGQNLLNRNPSSTLATAAGLHPFLRLLYARWGTRHCPVCHASLTVLSDDQIVERLVQLSSRQPLAVSAVLLRGVAGSHRTLLQLLAEQFAAHRLILDGLPYEGGAVAPGTPHDLCLSLTGGTSDLAPTAARQLLEQAKALGAHELSAHIGPKTGVHLQESLVWAPVCSSCGYWFQDLTPTHFHRPCPHCEGQGCDRCQQTGLHPLAAAVRWQAQSLPALLTSSVDAVQGLVQGAAWPTALERLRGEIVRRLEALQTVGLGYVALDRPSPSLSRGEAQRVRLAVALTSQLEDMLHVLDEPTIGQHPADVKRLLPAFRRLRGPVLYVEHDRIAAAAADHAIDLGPGAGHQGGRITFAGTPADLWRSDTPTGRYFSLRQRVTMPARRPPLDAFLTLYGAHLRNLRRIDVPIPLGRLTVISGVSGSGKSTLAEDVLAASLKDGAPLGCEALQGSLPKVIVVDQSPIGRNPRSNPATYTKLSDILRDLYARVSGLSASHFSFNRPEGACPVCLGIGAIEVKMRYLPSTWVTCAACAGQRFTEEVLAARLPFGERLLSFADLLDLAVDEVLPLLREDARLSDHDRRAAVRILRALRDVGLGYVTLGQPSPTLSGGEAQRVKLARYLGQRSLASQMIIMDEPTTGLHPQDIAGLLVVMDRLVRRGATLVVVEHNTDIMRAADWLVDLGPGAGPLGGELLYAGPPDGIGQASAGTGKSETARALADEDLLQPAEAGVAPRVAENVICIEAACAHNLKHVSVEIAKGKLTVVTGVSGSGKSSLVVDVLESEARRRLLESLSLYERQSTREGPEADVASVTGLGVSVMIDARHQHRFDRRASVGSTTEILHHLAALLARIGELSCLACGGPMERQQQQWSCPHCGTVAPLPQPRHFSPATYAAACQTCQGVGTLRKPNPDKLIIHPDLPLCGGAMYSPGFFPQGYLCQPFNGGYDMVQGLARNLGFDPARTPWREMTPAAQQAFLYGTDEPIEVVSHSRKGISRVRQEPFPGFYGWIRDWDAHGTYTDTQICPSCQGGLLRPQYAAVTLAGHNLQSLGEMHLTELDETLAELSLPREHPAAHSLDTVKRRLTFLKLVGLGYLHLYRDTETLSAGEAQRIKLAGLLGAELTSLTVLLDEPSRGLHPVEVGALAQALTALRDEGNTLVVVEHDPLLIQAADQIIDMGPGAGHLGGQVMAMGTPEQIMAGGSLTGSWLAGRERGWQPSVCRQPRSWMTVQGAAANNLKGQDIRLPLGVLVGVCGVSGSGKSSLVVDTLGRALAPRRHTTSVAYQEMEPGAHRAIVGAPKRVMIVDQTKAGVSSPARFLDLERPLLRHYAESEQALALGLDAKALGARCSACGGAGIITTDMGFMPDMHTLCETCQGSGCAQEAWQVHVNGLALPELNALTLDEIAERFAEVDRLTRPLQAAQQVGLGYLVFNQPGMALSGGEAQRLKIAQELCLKSPPKTLYILDEPTVGQHLADVSRLIRVLHELVAQGHSVIVIEHHSHLLAACDWLIELGPGGGPQGGQVIASGTPASVAAGNTPIAPFVREVMRS